jgi:hypothetical protein
MSHRKPLWKAAPFRFAAAALLAAVIVAACGVTVALAATVNVRIETPERTIFSGPVTLNTRSVVDTGGVSYAESNNVMSALVGAAQIGAFPLAVSYSGYGAFINSIDGEWPVWAPDTPWYWVLRVNGAFAEEGPSAFALKNGDTVLEYAGADTASPTVAVAPSVVVVGSTARIVAEQLDSNGVASPLAGATVHVGSRVATSDAEGAVLLPMNQVGVFGVRVEKTGFIRSGLSSMSVRYATAFTRFSADKNSVRSGATVTLGGTLACNGKGFSGRSVWLYTKKKGSSVWVGGAGVATNSAGKFSLKVRPRKSTSYKVVFAGDPTHVSATSATKLVTVR